MLILFISTLAMLFPCFLCDNYIERTEQPIIEKSIHNYLKAEDDLWRLLESLDSTALEQIYNVNKRFLNASLRMGDAEQGMFDSDVVPANNVAKVNALVINLTAEFCLTHFEPKDTFFNKSVMIPYANYTKVHINRAENFYNVTSQSSFWTDIIEYRQVCQNKYYQETCESAYQVLFDYYKEIQASFLKHYVAMQVSYMILYFHKIDANKHRQESIEFRQKFLDRVSNIKNIARTHMKLASREVWVCDPASYYSSYDNLIIHSVQITNFLQSYVTNEANLNQGDSCTETCEYYGNTKYYNNQPNDELYKCYGKLRNCITTFDEATVCQVQYRGDRKIGYIKDLDTSHKSSMGNTSIYYLNENNIKISSSRRWFVQCSNCICTCDDPSTEKSDRFFSLREAVSDISKNKIVTGIHFSKPNRVIRLIIAERTLIPRLQTNATIYIKKNLFYTDEEEKIWQENQGEFDMEDAGVREGVDYHTLTYENRAINLDTVMVPRGQVVTGVRLRLTNGRLRLEVRGTEFEYSTGQLKNIEQSSWNWNPQGGQNKINLHNPGHPIQTPSKSRPNQMANSYIEFGPSGNWADAGQTTVPFLDSQPVEPYLPVGLSGVGIYYKGHPGYGGFIAPKLVIYDIPLSDSLKTERQQFFSLNDAEYR